MSLVLLLIRVLLALVFVVAGLAKLADLAGSRQALRDFGVPAALASPFGVLLPLAELAVAVALIPSVSAWWGAAGTFILLLVFVAGIGSNLARGRTPDCHCFGQLHSAPAGPSTLIRNLVLAALAGVLVLFGRTTAEFDLWSWLGQLALPQRIELLAGMVGLSALAVTLWLLWHVLRQQGRLLLRLEAMEARLAEAGLAAQEVDAPPAGLEVGTPAPVFSLADVQGETLTLADLRASGKPVLLLFADPGCGPCAALFPEVGRWQRDYAEKLTLAVISRGSKEANQSKVSVHGLERVLLQQDREVQTAYQVAGTPSLVLIRPDGTIGSRLAQGAEVIRSLVGEAIGLPALRTLPMVAVPRKPNGQGTQARPRPPALAIGEPAPDFSLPDLSGTLVTLSDFRGSRTLVLFWRPGCGFCQRMLPDLLAWEAQSPDGAPKLLVVSSESVESNLAMGLRSPVVLDQAGMSVGSTFGATGTPMAVLVDEEGKIASALAAGAPAVLALAYSGLSMATSA
jgi:methylamine dehydrogenase accessory protein MauD